MYKVIYAEGPYLYNIMPKIEESVKQLKSQGWTEQGGISISDAILDHVGSLITHHYTVAQAMVKNEK